MGYAGASGAPLQLLPDPYAWHVKIDKNDLE
jgi:hypothetical protein